MLNSKGQVLTWRLTPKLSFDEVEPDLLALKRRLDSQGKVLNEFYIDNCCSWRNKLKKVFGENLKVYLDIFHAVKRFGEKVPRRHPLRKECIAEWKMVFRDPSDHGEKRHAKTPPLHILDKNVKSFLERWEKAEYGGVKVLSAAALKEIAKIRVHFKKGCLSDIPPGRGTNRNENLHKDLNKIMSCSKYGVELAYSLLTTILYQHNERMVQSDHPIEYYSKKFQDTKERFGLKFNKTEKHYNESSEAGFRVLKLTTCTYNQLYQRILHTPLPVMGHSRQQNSFIVDEEVHEEVELDSSCCSTPEIESEGSIPICTLKQVLMRALSWFFIHKCMDKVSEAATLRLDNIPFLTSTLGDISTSMMLVDEEDKSALERLDLLLKSWNFSRLEVPRDGNCLFYAVAHNLKFQVQKGNTDLENILKNIGICEENSLVEIATSLRQGVVGEWIGKHSKEYQDFLTSDQLHVQAEQFRQDGTFSLDIGDLVIAALSNMLQVPIVIFTSRPNQPLHIQYPTHSVIVFPSPVYLAYLQTKSGHYDAVVQVDQSITEPGCSTNNACTCGRKSNFKGNACSFSLNKYSSRCPCYNEKRPCSKNCKCRGCTNSFGMKSEVPLATCGQKRKRATYDNQLISLKGRRTAEFMEAIGEPVITGTLSRMEFLVVCSIVKEVMEDLDWAHSNCLDHHEVLAMYDGIIELAETLLLDLALFKRSAANIEKLLNDTTFKWEIFCQKNMFLQ